MWGIPGCQIKPSCNHPGDTLLGKRDHLWLHLEERPGDGRGARSSSEFPSGSKMDSLLFLTKAFCRRHGVGLVENRSGSHFWILIEATSFNFTWKKPDQSLSNWSNLIKAYLTDQTWSKHQTWSEYQTWSNYLRLGNNCQTYQDLSLAGNPFQVGNYSSTW